MKTAKKALAILLALVMVFALGVSAMAASIDVTNVLDGEEYNAYKILNYTNSGDAYSYYLTAAEYAQLGKALEAAGFKFTQSADKSQYFVNNAKEIDAAAAAEALSKVENLNALKSYTTTGKDGKANFEGLETGYYFVTSSLGSLCALHDEEDIATVVEKNETFDKPSKAASDNEFQVGDTITYTITITDVAGTDNALKVTDEMSAGLTYKADTLKVVVNQKETTEGFTATPTADTAGAKLVIDFTAETIKALDKDQTIVITYDAVVNSSASLDGTEKNTVVLNYSEQQTIPVEVEVESFALTVNKTDGKAALKGAEFELYRTDAANKADHEIVKLCAVSDEELAAAKIEKAADTVYYQVDPSASNTKIDMKEASSAVIFGLDKDSTYFLRETKAPAGYNLLDKEQEVKPGENTVTIANEAGSVLPSTGSIGTTIFYIFGSILVIGAGVVLVSKRRMSE